jgi:hypothetical protein
LGKIQKMADKRIHLGKPIQLTDEQLDQAAQVTGVDIAKSREFWRNTAPKKWKTLLDAQPVEQEDDGEE